MTPETAIVRPVAGIRPAEIGPQGPILVRVPNGIGDAVLALPALTAVSKAYPDRAVVVVARRVVAPLFVGLIGVTAVVHVKGRGAARLSGMRRALPGERPAFGLILPDSFGAAAEIAVTRPRQMWGYGGPLRRLALDVALPSRWFRGRHRWEAYGLLVAAMTGRPVPERYPTVSGSGDVAIVDGLWAEAGIATADTVVGLVPGARDPARRWPLERFAELAARLAREGARVVVFGAAGDELLAEAIAERADPQPLDWTGRTPLPVLAECFRRLRLLVANDTGPMHLAGAVGTPLLGLFGPSCERRSGPRGPAGEAIVHSIHCRPCLDARCAYNHGCLRGVTVDRVVERVRARLGWAHRESAS